MWYVEHTYTKIFMLLRSIVNSRFSLGFIFNLTYSMKGRHNFFPEMSISKSSQSVVLHFNLFAISSHTVSLTIICLGNLARV